MLGGAITLDVVYNIPEIGDRLCSQLEDEQLWFITAEPITKLFAALVNHEPDGLGPHTGRKRDHQ